MKQPRKDVLREQLALAADEIIRLREQLAGYESADFIAYRKEWVQWVSPPSWIELVLRKLRG